MKHTLVENREKKIKKTDTVDVISPEEPKSKRGRGTKKTPVVGVKERSSKKVYAKVMLPNENGQKLTGKQLIAVLDEVCKEETTVVSDDFMGYKIYSRISKSLYWAVQSWKWNPHK